MEKKNPAAVTLGRLGGKARAKSLSKSERIAGAEKAVAARNKKLSPARRSEIARLAAQARHNRKPKKD
jgi:hypothetical protein